MRGPIARVVVDTPLPHLDRPFDYLIPEALDEVAQPGVRVRVRFAGRLQDGFLLERLGATDHEGRLADLGRVVSPEPVLTPAIAALARAVADRWAGTLSDVLRLAVPPRHAGAERATSRPGVPAPSRGLPDLSRYDGGPELLSALAQPAEAPQRPMRASWSMLPGDWPDELAAAVATAASSGGGVIVVVPDARDLARIGAALAAAVGADAVVELSAGLGPQERYRRFLRLLRGAARVAIGTRAAVWAPVTDLRLIVVWDDGDDLLAEPRAPYPHAREVAALRAHEQAAHLLLAGHSVSAEAQQLVETGWARQIDPLPAARTKVWPRIRAVDDQQLATDAQARAARLPTAAWRAARDGIAAGAPVLVQVPRRGYLPRLACETCRQPARCMACHGPLATSAGDEPPHCAWCGVSAAGWRCPSCRGERLRASVIGARRTAEELGRAFPGTPVRTSAGDSVLSAVPGGPAIVVATPGAEPPADGGYAAALLLDAWSLLLRPDLRAGEEALRRWLAAAALVRPSGQVVVTAASELPVVQALIAASPRRHAVRELADRRLLHLPPAARLAALTGPPTALAEYVGLLELPTIAEQLGPVDIAPAARGESEQPLERLLIRVPVARGRELAAALHAAAGVRSARKAGDPVRVVIDPIAVG